MLVNIYNLHYYPQQLKQTIKMERQIRSYSAIQTQKNKSSPQNIKKKKQKDSEKNKKNEQVPAEQKTLLCEVTRIRGQQKLLYIKKAKQKNIQDKQFFNKYPFCKLEFFTFNIDSLKQNGIVFRNQTGLHWIQSVEGKGNAHAIEHPHSHHTCDSNHTTLLNGWGISVFDDGKVFQGTYHDSYPCGSGYQLLPNGNTYIGGFKQGTKCGKGTYYWFSSSQVYTGDWLGGLPHGNGRYLSGNDLYQGNFCNGMKYGSGEQVFVNGDKYIGQYINGVADGYGQYFWIDGSFYKGDFKHGVRHGYGIWSDFKGTQIFSGCYRMDKKQGFGVYQWIDKQVYKGQFKQDFREGYGRLYQITKKSSSDFSQLDSAQKLVYSGMWLKGKQKPDIPVDQSVIKQLQSFINDKNLNSHHKKPRIGHQNCVPKDP